ncbi:Ig-like domain-containing protein [Agitococcus lubricus]|uniref:Big-1 domain-containing protein n=1 Tax=Agitococcus lubricus TaxID=1077255 RepID=A0A2T5IZX4_9GAMM|nr:Ig-like domain-containing protein [Agitococcus lubricus]PTQ89620.1 hypothetical protein C8N29_106151 [Agitococcus lubricus]
MHNWEHYSRLPAYLLTAALIASCGGGGKDELVGQSNSAITAVTDLTSLGVGETKTFSISIDNATGTSVQVISNGNVNIVPADSTTRPIVGGKADIIVKGSDIEGSGILEIRYTDAQGNIAIKTIPYSVQDLVGTASPYTTSIQLSAAQINPTGGNTATRAVFTILKTDGSVATDQNGKLYLQLSSSPGFGDFKAVLPAYPIGVETDGRKYVTVVNGKAEVDISAVGQQPIQGNLLIANPFTDNKGRITKVASQSFNIVNGYTVTMEDPARTEILSGGDSITLSAFVSDPAGAGVANQKVTFEIVRTTVDAKGTIRKDGELKVGANSASTVLTDTNGRANINLELDSADDRSNRPIVVLARIGSSSNEQKEAFTKVDVVGTTLAINTSTVNVKNGQDNLVVTATLRDAKSISIDGQPIRFDVGSGLQTKASTGEYVDGGQTVNTVSGLASTNVKIKDVNNTSVIAVASNLCPSTGTVKDTGISDSAVKEAVRAILLDSTQTKPFCNSVQSPSLGFIVSTLNFDIRAYDGKCGAEAATPLADAALLDINKSYCFKVDYSEVLPVVQTATLSRKINLATTLGTLGAANQTITDDVLDDKFAGTVKFDYTPTYPGVAVLRGDTRSSDNKSITVTIQKEFIATLPAKIAVQSDKTSLAVGGQTEIIAKVLDAKDNPVKGEEVEFSQLSDPSGGRLPAPVAETDANGIARVPYIAGALTTGKDTIKIQGKSRTSGKTASVDLTVGGKSVFLSIGTGNTIADLNSTTYALPHQITITDADGQPIRNQQVTLSVIPFKYYKGMYVIPVDGDTTADTWVPSISARCNNEDINLNGRLDELENNTNSDSVIYVNGPQGALLPYYTTPTTQSELSNNANTVQAVRLKDYGSNTPIYDILDNGDGLLWPGNPVTLSDAIVTTDANGIATYNVVYAKSFASWIQVRLIATTRVEGTESRVERVFDLVASKNDLKKDGTPPGGVESNFGTASSCTNPN